MKPLFTLTAIRHTGKVPVIPKAEKGAQTQAVQYDSKYDKNQEAAVTGVFVLATPILFIIFSILNYVKYEGYTEFIQVLLVGGLVSRIGASIWVASIAKEQNRNAHSWALKALLLPGATLIAIGQTKRIVDPNAWRKHLYGQNTSSVAQMTTRTTTNEQAYQMAS